MVRIYWPGKAVPSWLQKIEFKGTNVDKATASHDGIGVIAKVKGRFIVWGITGFLLRIEGAGCSVSITGQGEGVYYTSSFREFIGWLRRPCAH